MSDTQKSIGLTVETLKPMGQTTHGINPLDKPVETT